MSTTAAGTTIAIGAAAPATQDAAGYTALTLIVIGGVEQIGAIGAVTNKVEFQPLNGPKEKHKGSTDFGSLSPSIAHDDLDAGQILLRTASEPTNNTLYPICVTLPTGEKRYSMGRVFGYPETIGNADSIVMANPTIELNTKIVKVAAP